MINKTFCRVASTRTRNDDRDSRPGPPATNRRAAATWPTSHVPLLEREAVPAQESRGQVLLPWQLLQGRYGPPGDDEAAHARPPPDRRPPATSNRASKRVLRSRPAAGLLDHDVEAQGLGPVLVDDRPGFVDRSPHHFDLGR